MEDKVNIPSLFVPARRERNARTGKRGPVLVAIGVTEREERFCQAILDGLNMSEAYRRAYENYTGSNAAVSNSASHVMGRSRVAARLANLTKARETRELHNPSFLRSHIITGLYKQSTESSSDRDKITALVKLGEMPIVGLYTQPQGNELGNADSETLRQTLAEKLKSLLEPKA